jgi:hypothetical protein
MAWKKALPSCASRKTSAPYPSAVRAPGRRSSPFPVRIPPPPPMKSAFQIAFTVYGIAAVIALFVAALIQGLFVVVRRFNR